MITSLVLDKRYNIGINVDKFMLNGKRESIKEVPFVRYRFGSYEIEDTHYITEMQRKFDHSVHMVEVELDSLSDSHINLIDSQCVNVPVYLYVPITDTEIESNSLDEEKEELLYELVDNGTIDKVERLMIRDRSTSLYVVSANRIKERLASITGLSANNIGICGSPLSFGENACISAMRGRDMIAYFGDPEKCKIPSANHQCMNSCGCIHYTPVTMDSEAPETLRGKPKSIGTEQAEPKPKKTKEQKQPKEPKPPKEKKAPKPKKSKAPIAWF